MIPESTGVIEILYQDDEIAVIDKPPATLAHPHSFDRHTPNVQALLERQLKRPVHVVHRLDRMTTGIMVLALNPAAAHHLALQFRERTTRKRYLAVVRGHTPDAGRIDSPLQAGSGQFVEADTSFTTLCRGTVYEAVGRFPEAWFSLIRIDLHTGRRHQARRHLHQIDHPVLGDNRHGDKAQNRWAAARFGVRHLYLRASEIEFEHPVSGQRVHVVVPLPELWHTVARSMGMRIPESLPEAALVESSP